MKKYVNKCIVRRGSSKLNHTDHLLLETTFNFPGINKIKQKSHRRVIKPSLNVCLLDNPDINQQYTDALNRAFQEEPENDTVQLHHGIVDQLHQVTSEICEEQNLTNPKQPWENKEFRTLTKSQREINDKALLKVIQIKVENTREKLMSEYYSKKPYSINNASETRTIDREFAEAKKYNMHRQTSKLLVSKESLHKHFYNTLEEVTSLCQRNYSIQRREFLFKGYN